MISDSVLELFQYIKESPSAFHAVFAAASRLEAAGFTPLRENAVWTLTPGSSYYVTRGGSSLIAFTLPAAGYSSFRMIASHSDSPAFKVKENPELAAEGHYVCLNTERYGGMIYSSWFDRPLSAAGRVLVKTENGVRPHLVNLAQDLAVIPNLAIHFNREINDGYKYNAQKDLLPLFGSFNGTSLKELAAAAANANPNDILDMDLFLYNRQEGTCFGADGEYILCPRLDNLQCAFSSLQALLAAECPEDAVLVSAIFDNEEVGSGTKQGALSTFLKEVLQRISLSFSKTTEEHLAALAGSFLLSADNGHAVHPNYPDRSDASNRPYLNGGVLIKYNAAQKYTSDGISAAVFKNICQKNGIPFQTFVNRSDIAGGSTLGNFSNSQVSVTAVDIGTAQLAMHSACETGGTRDTQYLIDAMQAFYSTRLHLIADGSWNC